MQPVTELWGKMRDRISPGMKNNILHHDSPLVCLLMHFNVSLRELSGVRQDNISCVQPTSSVHTLTVNMLSSFVLSVSLIYYSESWITEEVKQTVVL